MEIVLGHTVFPKGMFPMYYRDRLRKLGLHSMEKRRLQGELIATFQCIKGS